MAERELADEAAMSAFGAELAAWLRPPKVVYLHGPLGAGKTTLVRAVLRALGHDGPVRSPTYTLVETYLLGHCEVHHLDLYRIADADELEFLGLRDLASERALWLVEWPERGADDLPRPDVELTIAFADQHGRRVTGVPDALADIER